jgi:hypothetical protein
MALTKVDSILVDGAITTDASGNVGIGTSSPTNKLQVDGIAQATTVRANGLVGEGDASNPHFSFSVNTNTGIFRADNNQIGFSTNGTERMRITSAGDLFIGTPSVGGDQPKLASVSTGRAAFFRCGNSSANTLFANTSGTTTYSACIFLTNGGGTQVGAINVGASSTTYLTSSDYRLKDNIAPMTGALAKVSALKPVTYKWKADGSDGQGFIAHELQEVVPDCVSGEKDAVDAEGNPVYQGIDTSFLVATLTAAIQEQQAIITDLKSRIETLEAK